MLILASPTQIDGMQHFEEHLLCARKFNIFDTLGFLSVLNMFES